MAVSWDRSSTAVPSENRFARFTSDNHSAPIWITTLLSLIYAVCVLGVRLGFVKWNAHGLDDAVLTAAHLVGFGMWGSLFLSLNSGLGKSATVQVAAEIARMQKSFVASRIFLYIALALSKCSSLLFVKSVFTYMPKLSLAANVAMAAIAIWGAVGAIAGPAMCPPNRILPAAGSGGCSRQVPLLEALTVLDVLSELTIIMLPVVGLRGLQMPTKRRLLVVLAFSLRLPNIVASIMYLLTYSDFSNHHRSLLDIDTVVVWQNILLSYNLMSATIPTLKGFVKGFTTGGVGYTGDLSGQGSGKNGSYQLHSLPRPTAELAILPAGYPESEAQVTSLQRSPRGTAPKDDALRDRSRSNQDENGSMVSYDSQRIMLKREWKVSRE